MTFERHEKANSEKGIRENFLNHTQNMRSGLRSIKRIIADLEKGFPSVCKI